MDDHALAVALARTAGTILTGIRTADLLASKELGATGDAVAHSWLANALGRLRPADGLLSEEAYPRSEQLTEQSRPIGGRRWIVDPLDGTREFSEGRDDWAVHVALVTEGQPDVAAVALPGLELVLSTAEPIKPPALAGPLRIAVSRSRPPAFATALAERLGAQLVPIGSAGFKAMAVVRGQVHAYLHAGGQYEWDSAAPVGVARHAGLHTSRIDGSPLTFGNTDAWSPDLLICLPALADRLLGAISQVTEQVAAQIGDGAAC